VKLRGRDLAVAVLMGAGGLVIAAGLTRAMRQAGDKRQQETERKLRELTATVKALQAREAKRGELQGSRAPQGKSAVTSTAAENEAGQKGESPKPAIVAALTAAATTYLGKKARIRSAQLLPAEQSSAGAWAQQGRVSVQTSHNLRPRG
jgi:hypothetical protein